MDSIIRIKLTPEDYITGFICRFCMLPCDQNEMLQIPWNEWQHSLLAAMYERIMQQELFISKECSEFCCKKCSDLLSQTVAALDMFQRSDECWRKLLKVSNSMIQPKNEYLEHDEDDQAPEYLQSSEPQPSLALEFIKTEVLDDFEFGEFGVKPLDTAQENENIFAEPLTDSDAILEDKSNANKKRIKKQITKLTMPANNEPFPCSQCDELCRTRVLLTRHMMSVHSLKLCVRCNFTASDSITLKRHDRTEHKQTIDTISVCPKCKKIFTDPLSLSKHMKCVHDPFVPSQCHICSKIFRNQVRLRLHVETHSEPRLQCDICSKMFRLKKHMVWHMQNTHIRNINCICSKCGKYFTDYSAWKFHESKACSAAIAQRAPLDRTGKFSCNLCHRKFSTLNYGRTHYRKEHHIEDMTRICLVCNHLASSANELGNHQECMHIELRCPICKRFCKTDVSLKLHIAMHSSKDRSFVCSICQASFVKMVALNTHHKRIHTTDRPFKCTDCDLRFTENCEMKAHWRHKHEHIRKIKCDSCDKTFVTMSELRTHEPNHTGIGHRRCKMCDLTFRHIYQLTKHMNTYHPNTSIDTLA